MQSDRWNEMQFPQPTMIIQQLGIWLGWLWHATKVFSVDWTSIIPEFSRDSLFRWWCSEFTIINYICMAMCSNCMHISRCVDYLMHYALWISRLSINHNLPKYKLCSPMLPSSSWSCDVSMYWFCFLVPQNLLKRFFISLFYTSKYCK